MPFPVALGFIEETERKLGVSFPVGFRARMSRDNGGEISTDEDDWQLQSTDISWNDGAEPPPFSHGPR